MDEAKTLTKIRRRLDAIFDSWDAAWAATCGVTWDLPGLQSGTRPGARPGKGLGTLRDATWDPPGRALGPIEKF